MWPGYAVSLMDMWDYQTSVLVKFEVTLWNPLWAMAMVQLPPGTKSKMVAAPCYLHILFHSQICWTMRQVYLASLKSLHETLSELWPWLSSPWGSSPKFTKIIFRTFWKNLKIWLSKPNSTVGGGVTQPCQKWKLLAMGLKWQKINFLKINFSIVELPPPLWLSHTNSTKSDHMWSDMSRPKCGKPLTLVLRQMHI